MKLPLTAVARNQPGTITIELDTTRAMVFANEANTRGFVALAVVNPDGLLQVSLPENIFFKNLL